MDITKTVTHISLCAGYGGIDLGLKRVVPNLRTIAFSEIEAYACANLVAKMEAGYLDAAPIWTNLKTFPWGAFRDRVDLLSGGYPCQPFSSAGKRLGKDDSRHLWPYIADGIRAMRPRQCFFENVDGHISLGLREVIEELESIGYATTWGVFSANEVGAPHQRKRVFILAYDSSKGLQRNLAELLNAQGWQEPCGPVGCGSGFGGKIDLANANGARGWEDWQSSQSWPTRPGEQQYGWEPPRVVADPGSAEQHRLPESSEWNAGFAAGEPSNARQAQPPMGRVPYGSASRVDELRLLGNGVVPATAAKAFTTLIKQK